MAGKFVRHLAAAGIVVLVVCSGCGKTWHQNEVVEGTAKMDGTPLAGVMVQFIPDGARTQGPSSTGYTDDKGHFTLACDNKKSGAVIGTHNVLVFTGRGAVDENNPAAPPRQAAAIPNVYTIATKTPLQIEVRADEHNYDLDLSRNPPARK